MQQDERACSDEIERRIGKKNWLQTDAGFVQKEEELILDLYRLANTEGDSLIRPERQPTTSSRGCAQQCHFQHLETIQPSSPLLRSSAHFWLRCYELGYRKVRLLFTNVG
jgi:hypothetical protein